MDAVSNCIMELIFHNKRLPRVERCPSKADGMEHGHQAHWRRSCATKEAQLTS